MSADDRQPPTLPVAEPSGETVEQFRVEVVAGDDTGAALTPDGPTCAIGTEKGNDLVLTDPTVSRFHCEIALAGKRFRVRDLGSRNGTRAGGVHIGEGSVASRAELTLGRTRVRVVATGEQAPVTAATRSRFGALRGESPAMRRVFGELERVAASDATVLIEGETGTGKEGAAAGVHAASTRSDGPLVVLDCGALPATLIESELFGHEAGAFTGANERRAGAFEEASGGTLLLDEIGELPLDLQPKLLRALESRTITRLGSRTPVECNVRVIAATHRDLRAEVNEGRFRADLYYRLAIVRVVLPPLRERRGDIPLLVAALLEQLGASGDQVERLTASDFVDALARARWPGNVRELRNHLERCLVMREATVPETAASAPEAAADLAYDEARRRSIEAFERRYVSALLERCDGNVAAAAREAGMNRAYLYRLIKRYGLR